MASWEPGRASCCSATGVPESRISRLIPALVGQLDPSFVDRLKRLVEGELEVVNRSGMNTSHVSHDH
jgi:hypothetical protein